jgi:hypothetical protein
LAAAVFTLAVKLQPCIIFIDEIGKLMYLWGRWVNPVKVTNSMEQHCLWGASSSSASLPTFYGTLISVLTRTWHLSLLWAKWIHSIPSHPLPLRLILILFSHLCLWLPCG